MTMIRRLSDRPWIWSFIGMFLVWLATAIYTGGTGSAEVITAALSFATFTVIVGIGQMFVITTGPGNVDLSTLLSFHSILSSSISPSSHLPPLCLYLLLPPLTLTSVQPSMAGNENKEWRRITFLSSSF